MDQGTGRDHDPTKKGEHLEDPMMVTMDAKARAAQEAELKAMFAGVKSARSEATEATPEAKDKGGFKKDKTFRRKFDGYKVGGGSKHNVHSSRARGGNT